MFVVAVTDAQATVKLVKGHRNKCFMETGPTKANPATPYAAFRRDFPMDHPYRSLLIENESDIQLAAYPLFNDP